MPIGAKVLDDSMVLSVGVLLLAALVAGQIAYWIRLPRVTAYLSAGLILGPHATGWIPTDHWHQLEPLGDLAMALVLFNMGCHFSLAYIRRILRRALKKSAGELTATFILVAGSLLLATSLMPNIGLSWQAAILLGVLAMATAPATTVLVLRENETEGPVTEFATTLVAFNNLAAIILFEIVLAGLFYFGQQGGEPLAGTMAHLVLVLTGSCVVGFAAGIVISYACGLIGQGRWLMLLIAVTTLVLGVCQWMQIPYLLAFLVMGTLVANASDRTSLISGELDRVTGLLCLIFFVVSGAELDLGALMAMGTVGVIYTVARSTGKYMGIYLVADGKHNPDVKKWLGATLLSQAGAAIALTQIAKDQWPSLGAELSTVILGTVAFFEIAGPIMLRQAVLGAGEVPLRKAIRHETTTVWREARNVLNRLLLACGIDPWRSRQSADLTAGDLMRKHYDSLSAAADFDAIVSLLEHSHDNVFPVIDADGTLVGTIRYAHLRDAVFDRQLGPLVCAADLAVAADYPLHSDTPLDETWRILQKSQDDLWPVVSREDSPSLLGMIARRDVYRFFLGRSQPDSDH